MRFAHKHHADAPENATSVMKVSDIRSLSIDRWSDYYVAVGGQNTGITLAESWKQTGKDVLNKELCDSSGNIVGSIDNILCDSSSSEPRTALIKIRVE